MTTVRRPFAGVAVVLAAVTAAAGSGGRAAERAPAPADHASVDEPLDGSRLLGPTPPGAAVEVVLQLRGRDLAGLERLSRSGARLAPGEVEARFAPDGAAVSRLVAVLSGAGLAARWGGGDLLPARGSASAVERLFGVVLEERETAGGHRFRAPDREPAIPAALAGDVVAVEGLDDRDTVSTAAVPPGGVRPSDMLSFYDVRPLADHGLDGGGETIGLLEIDDVPGGAGNPDLRAFADANRLPSYDLEVRHDSDWGSPMNPGQSGIEAVSDVELIHAIAPRAKLVVYTASPRGPELSLAEEALIREHPTAIVNESLQACELTLPSSYRRTRENDARRESAQGMTHYAASGDNGAFQCASVSEPSVSFPAALAEVTAVGGTTVYLGTQGGYGQEQAWGGAISQSGGGGGLSRFSDRPDYQRGPGTDRAESNGHRQVPDVSGNADPETGWAVVVRGRRIQFGGTSAAAPLWSAITALIDQQLGRDRLRRLGFANPALYWIGQHLGDFAAAPFHDVTAGANLRYPAQPGWDFATGLGSPDASALLDAVEAYERQNPAGGSSPS